MEIAFRRGFGITMNIYICFKLLGSKLKIIQIWNDYRQFELVYVTLLNFAEELCFKGFLTGILQRKFKGGLQF